MSYVKTLVAGAYVALALTGFGCAEDPEESSGNAMGMPTAGVSGAGGQAMPCAVETVVAKHCKNCHGATPSFGAPMSLLTASDFQRDYMAVTTAQLKGQPFKMYDLARIRINREMGTTPMPQGLPLGADEMTTINQWLMMGAPAGTACAPTGSAGDAAMTGGVGGVVTAGAGGVGGVVTAGAGGAGGVIPPAGGGGGAGGTDEPFDPTMIDDQCLVEGAFDALVAKEPGEICYDFLVHGNFGEDDTSKFNVPADESYNQFYYSIPWPAGYVATRFGQKFDNKAVLHHWLMFAQGAGMTPGTVEPNVLGTTLFTDAELVAGWAVGGCTTTYPANVGVHLPSTGVIMIQWHHYNNTGGPAQDGTSVQICAVPESMREHKAGLTFLGTETMSVPAGMEAKAGGTCLNDSGAPITILGFTPHMHTIGIHMQSEVTRATGGMIENVFDMPFQFDYQTNYMMKPPGVVLQPGDSITSTCTYQNNGVSTVNFGQSTKAEMCYQFALAYPYGALNNGVLSLIGATNTCW